MDRLLDKYDIHFAAMTLRPAAGGRFEISIDGRTIFSKLTSGRFPADEELDRLVEEVIGA